LGSAAINSSWFMSSMALLSCADTVLLLPRFP
jgi:hypothetical protein